MKVEGEVTITGKPRENFEVSIRFGRITIHRVVNTEVTRGGGAFDGRYRYPRWEMKRVINDTITVSDGSPWELAAALADAIPERYGDLPSRMSYERGKPGNLRRLWEAARYATGGRKRKREPISIEID